MSTRRAWTTQEIQELIDMRSRGLTAYSISRKLNRPIPAVYKRLSNMNVIIRPRWTIEEVEFVKAHFKSDGVEYCSKELGRSPDAINSYISVHNLFKGADET